MNHMKEESEEGTHSTSQSELSLTDEGSSGETVVTGSKPKKGPWTSTEDALLMEYVKKHGEGNWNAVQKNSGLFRCGKSCRLRWANHLRPNLKKGAFTAEEERRIIELHAQMGNKWAHMAAQLPGRTDNEIKNYWNTRIKRRQRSGQPLYPPEVCLSLQHNQCHFSSGFNSGEKRHRDYMDDIPDCVLSVLKTNHDLMSYVPEIPHISSSSLLVRDPSSSQYCSFVPPTMHCQKKFRESMPRFSNYDVDVIKGVPQFEQILDDQCTKLEQSFGLSFPYVPDGTMIYHLPMGITQDSHSLNNGNFSASKPTLGAVNSELPSLQYAETDLDTWDPCSIQPALPESVDALCQPPLPTGTVKFECTSPHNSGMLENIVSESMTLINAQNRSSNMSDSFIVPLCDIDIANSMSTQNLREADRGLYDEPISPYFRSASAPSLFSECTPLSGGAIPVHDETQAGAFPGLMVKSEPIDQVLKPDEKNEVSQGSDWPEQNIVCNEEQTIVCNEEQTIVCNEEQTIVCNEEQTIVCNEEQNIACNEEQNIACNEEQTAMSPTLATILGGDYWNDYNHTSPEPSLLSLDGNWDFGSCPWNNMPAARASLSINEFT